MDAGEETRLDGIPFGPNRRFDPIDYAPRIRRPIMGDPTQSTSSRSNLSVLHWPKRPNGVRKTKQRMHFTLHDI